MLSPKIRRVLQASLAALVAVFLFVVSDAFREPHIVEAGDKAPSFKVTTEDGRTLTRSDFGGKLLVLNFWGTWCAPCRQEWPSLDEMQKTMASQGVVVVAVSVDKDEKQYREFLQQTKPSFKTTRDLGGELSAEYGTFKYPETYIIDRDGKVREKMIGAENWMSPELLARLKQYL